MMRPDILQKIMSSPADQVNLENMQIQDDELEEIALTIVNEKPDVREIYLNNNSISDLSAPILKEQLLRLYTLNLLDLQFNNLSKHGAILIFSLKKENPSLTISCHGNQIKDVEEMKEIEDAAYRLNT